MPGAVIATVVGVGATLIEKNRKKGSVQRSNQAAAVRAKESAAAGKRASDTKDKRNRANRARRGRSSTILTTRRGLGQDDESGKTPTAKKLG